MYADIYIFVSWQYLRMIKTYKQNFVDGMQI